MLQFTPTFDDAVELATWSAERDGSALRSRVYFWVSGTALSGLAGAAIGAGSAAAIGWAWRVPGLVGLGLGLLCGLLAMQFTADLRQAWSNRRIRTTARYEYRDRGPVQAWLDADGLNVSQDGLHTHLRWSALAGILDTAGGVIIKARTGLARYLPRRAGAAEVEELRSSIEARLQHGERPTLDAAALAVLPPMPSPGHRADLEFTLSATDVQAWSNNAQRYRPTSPAERDYRLGLAARSLVLFTLLALPFARAALGRGPTTAIAGLAFGLVAAGVAWLVGGRTFAARRTGEYARAALHEFAAVSDRRALWLEPDGLGWSDATISRKAAWASLILTQTPDHYFFHTTDLATGVVIPRRIGSAADAFIAAAGPHLPRSCGGGASNLAPDSGLSEH